MSFVNNGYELLENLLNEAQLKSLNAELMPNEFPSKSGGIRNAEKKYSSILKISSSKKLLDIARKYLNDKPSLVRAILFNKSSENNWLVTWHQDKTVAVNRQFEDSEWGPWSLKEGVFHVQPPLEVLNQMITIRIHLDESCIQNGCLKIFPKSHLLGIISQSTLNEYVKLNEPENCEAKAGSVLVMRPNLIHSSSKADVPTQRRVLHLEYSSFKLPLDIQWA